MRTKLNFILTAAALMAGSLAGAAPKGGMTVALDSVCTFQALSWSMIASAAPSAGGSQGAGAPSVSVTATKNVDTCSPTLYSRLIAGTRIKDVTFTAAGSTQPELTLNSVLITTDDFAGTSTGGLATETIAFSFQTFVTKDTAPSSTGTTDINVNIAGLCSFSATSWSIGASVPVLTGSTGTSEGKPITSNLSLTKPLDSCSQSIVQALSAGKQETSLVLIQTDPASGSSITLSLGTVSIASYTVGEASAAGQTIETVGIRYGIIQITAK